MDDWITVHLGPVWQVELYSGLLAEHGIQAFLPDANTKRMDPFATGALPMDAQLRVRVQDADRAREVLENAVAADGDNADLDALALSTLPDPDLGVSLEEASAPDDVASIGSVRLRAEDAIERLAARTRWAAVMYITFPWAIAYGLRYLGVARRRGIRAAKHGLTVAAIGLAVLEPLVLIALWFLVRNANAEPDWY